MAVTVIHTMSDTSINSMPVTVIQAASDTSINAMAVIFRDAIWGHP